MERYSDSFISDVAQLMLRHGHKSLYQLTQDLSAPSNCEHRRKLVDDLEQCIRDLTDAERRREALEGLSQLPKMMSAAVPGTQNKPLRRSAKSFTYDDIEIPQMADADPRTVATLDAIYERFTAKESTLKRRRTLIELADELNVPVAKRDSMPQMVQKMLNSLASRNLNEVEAALTVVKEADRGSTESFMELASFITRDRDKTDASADKPLRKTSLDSATEGGATRVMPQDAQPIEVDRTTF